MNRFRLVSAAVALATLLAACDKDVAPVFEPQGTGTLEGLIFFDADRNGIFDPAAGDSAVRNVRVSLLERGTSQTLANGSGQTGANGRFLLSEVRPGTHHLRIDTTSIPTGMRFCENPVPVTVYIDERQFHSVGGRPACIISIAAAEKTRNVPVVIQGIVTAHTGQLRSQNDYTYIQDETGGIRIFSTALANRGLANGDRVEVTGVVSVFSNDLQLGGTVTVGAIQKNVSQVVPQDITTGALQAALTENTEHPLIGSLVRLRKARIMSIFGAPPINGRNVRIDTGNGQAQMRIESGVVPGADAVVVGAQLTTQYPIGKCYDITGVTGAFNQDAQIFPRTLSDIVEVPCT